MTDLTLVSRIAARPSIVFEALTTSEGLAAWWGPDEVPVILAQIDARVGGAYRVRFGTVDGLVHEAFGECLEVAPPRRLVLSWNYAAGGEPEEAGRTSRVAFDLRAIDTGTELTLTQTGLRNDDSRRSHEHGWSGSLTKLARHFDRAAAGASHTEQATDES